LSSGGVLEYLFGPYIEEWRRRQRQRVLGQAHFRKCGGEKVLLGTATRVPVQEWEMGNAQGRGVDRVRFRYYGKGRIYYYE
jgi:hypothetical protein